MYTQHTATHTHTHTDFADDLLAEGGGSIDTLICPEAGEHVVPVRRRIHACYIDTLISPEAAEHGVPATLATH